MCLNDTALSAPWSYQAAQDLKVESASAYHRHHHLGHGEWKNTGDTSLPPSDARGALGRVWGTRLYAAQDVRSQTSGSAQEPTSRRKSEGLGTPGPLLPHERLSSQRMGSWERGAVLWECFLEEVDEVWTFGLVGGGESSLLSRGTVVGNQWQ